VHEAYYGLQGTLIKTEEKVKQQCQFMWKQIFLMWRNQNTVEYLGYLNNAFTHKHLWAYEGKVVAGPTEPKHNMTRKNLRQPEEQKLLLSPLRETDEGSCFYALKNNDCL